MKYALRLIARAEGSFGQAMEMSRENDPRLYHRTLRQSMLLRCRIGQGGVCISEREGALEENPGCAETWVDLAHAYFFGGQVEDALHTCEKALEKFPEEKLLHVYAGDACRELRRYDQAFAHWEKGAADGEYMDAMFSMAFCRAGLGQFDKAAVIWEEIACRLEARGLQEEAVMPRNMAESCRARLG